MYQIKGLKFNISSGMILMYETERDLVYVPNMHEHEMHSEQDIARW